MSPSRRASTGSIPACAGEPILDDEGVVSYEVYPRVCGGAHHKHHRTHWHRGLSPRVRGSPSVIIRSPIRAGSIPACAGEPPHGNLSRRNARVYPRVCGGATSSDDSGRGRGSFSVYPRVCGGAGSQTRLSALDTGLSPRVRGSLHPSKNADDQRGSIPACAGEPCSTAVNAPMLWVYPRVCGGARTLMSDVSSREGLSPRVRGSPITIPEVEGQLGSIPACAGEPRRRGPRRNRTGVYPRVCGGARRRHNPDSRRPDLSPRVRGSRTHRQRRSIP